MDISLYPLLIIGGGALGAVLLVLSRWQWRNASQGYLWRDRFDVAAWIEVGACAALAVFCFGIIGWISAWSLSPPLLQLGPTGLLWVARGEFILVMLQSCDVFQRATDNVWMFEQAQRDERARLAYEQRTAEGTFPPPPAPPRRAVGGRIVR